MLEIKEGVTFAEPTAPLGFIASRASEVFAHFAVAAVITSASDGKHLPNSKHYSGEALDFRTHHLPQPDRDAALVAAMLADALGADFDVVLEKDHLHVEYDPQHPEPS